MWPRDSMTEWHVTYLAVGEAVYIDGTQFVFIFNNRERVFRKFWGDGNRHCLKRDARLNCTRVPRNTRVICLNRAEQKVHVTDRWIDCFINIVHLSWKPKNNSETSVPLWGIYSSSRSQAGQGWRLLEVFHFPKEYACKCTKIWALYHS